VLLPANMLIEIALLLIVFKHDEFITSKMNLDKAKKEMETLRDGLLQVQSGGTFTYGGVTYNKSNVYALSDKYNSQSGAFSGMEKVHEILRTIIIKITFLIDKST
jgi:hypothetical protein